MLRIPVLALLASVAVVPVLAQGQKGANPEELQKRRAAKLGKPVFQNAAWVLDYDAARKAAKDSGKLVLAYFTRSYAGCNPCDILEAEVLATPEFAEWSKQ